jgi:hypothetical protein
MDNTIVSLFEPTIKLDELRLKDYSYGTVGGFPEQQQKSIEVRGVEYPHIQINEYIFGSNEILSMEIDTSDILPTIFLKVNLATSGEFLSTSFPKDGDLINLFIRGRDDLYKPIRNDYLITSVSTKTNNATNEGKFSTIVINGELYVPGLYDELNYAESGTSYEVMKKTAKKLNLGFASNELSTNDDMIWLSAKDSYFEFLKHLIGCAWKDENSFFTFFIDIYYHLNFVNVNPLIKYDAEMLIALAEDPNTSAANNYEYVSKGLENKCLSNHPSSKRTQFFIQSFKPINNSSQIVKTYGYAFNATFFEHNTLRAWQLQGKSLITAGAEKDKILLRGRPFDTKYNTWQKYNFIGLQHSKPEHNTHENFLYSRVHNMMNNLEMDKLNVEAVLNKFNLNLYRYENIPAVFTVTNDLRRMKKLNADSDGDLTSDDANTLAIDKFYTGFYLIKGFRINYRGVVDNPTGSSNFSQTLILSRREWPSPTGS